MDKAFCQSDMPSFSGYGSNTKFELTGMKRYFHEYRYDCVSRFFQITFLKFRQILP